MFKEKFNISKIAQSVKEHLRETDGNNRQWLEIIKADTEFLADEDKKKIIRKFKEYGWDIEYSIKEVLEDKYKQEAKKALIEELFPEFFKEESEENN